jgi:Ca2+-binding EF-hand superfamily protein
MDCPDGLLSKQKFEIAYDKLYPNGNASKFSNYLFDAFDKDKSGSIDFVEFLSALYFLSFHDNIRDTLVFVFRVYDIGKLIDLYKLKIYVRFH